MGIVVVLFGPSLPGRDLLERALETKLPETVRIVAGAFATVAERRAIARSLAVSGDRPLFAAWACSATEAEREIFRRYVSMPRRQAELRWQEFLDDAARREAPGREAWPLVTVHAGDRLDEGVARIVSAIDAEPAREVVPRRVLVVDDEDAQRDLLADAFELLGCSVARAGDGASARALATAGPFDLLVTDHEMPGQKGTDLAADLRALQPQLNVAIVTAHPDAALDAELASGAVDLVLAKPIGIADLVHVLDELARRRPSSHRPSAPSRARRRRSREGPHVLRTFLGERGMRLARSHATNHPRVAARRHHAVPHL